MVTGSSIVLLYGGGTLLYYFSDGVSLRSAQQKSKELHLKGTLASFNSTRSKIIGGLLKALSSRFEEGTTDAITMSKVGCIANLQNKMKKS